MKLLISKISSCYLVLSLSIGMLAISGCSELPPNDWLGMGAEMLDVLGVSDKQITELSEQVCKNEDLTHTVLPENGPETRRIKRIARGLDGELLGQPLSFKVYKANEFNAFATFNGCVRVNSAKMDYFSDEELAAVIAHEMGHVALKHTSREFKTMGLTTLALKTISNYGRAELLNSPLFQKIVLGLINGQYSQKQELEADNYAVLMLHRHHMDPHAVVHMLQKLNKLYGESAAGPLSYFASHPSNEARIQSALKQIQAFSKRTQSQ
ncbi:MAG: M48 family metalloprotease [Neisseriaceae bacterium]